MDEIRDLLPFYALDALTPQEHAAVEAWLLDHPEGWDEIHALQIGVQTFAESVEPIEPPQTIKSDLMARITTERDTKTDGATVPSVLLRRNINRDENVLSAAPTDSMHQTANRPRSSWWERLRSWFSDNRAGYVAAGSFALATLVFIWGVSLYQNLRSSNQLISNLETTEIALRDEVAQGDDEIDSLEATITALDKNDQQQVVALEATITAQEAYQDSSTDEIDELLKKVIDQNERITQLEEENTQSNNQLAELTRENRVLARQVTEQETLILQYIDPSSPELRVFNIAGTEANEAANAHVLFEPSSENALLLVSDLVPLSEDQTYQFWLIDEVPVSAGLFEIDDNGTGGHVFTSDKFRQYNAVGVSIEPNGGSDQPTGDIVLISEI